MPPARHASFYCAQRITLNLTRADMASAGWSPSVRLFEAAACGVPVISDSWPGLEAFFVPGREIFVSRSADETLDYLVALPEAERQAVAAAARARVLSAHTADDRARELEAYVAECR
jgi:spore maturation protein CgeB